MKIKLLAGDIKLAEELDQLPAQVNAYVGQGRTSLVDAINAPHGVPAGGQYSVDVSYDARMVNNLDINTTFTSSGSGSNLLDTCDPPITGGSTPNTVPLGYIFVIRKIGNLLLYAINPSSGFYNYIAGVDLYARGSAEVQINKSSIKTGTFNMQTGSMYDSWIIVDEGQSITMNIGAYVFNQNVINSGLYNAYWRVDVYGHLIEKNTASQFVISNSKEGQQQVSVSKGKL